MLNGYCIDCGREVYYNIFNGVAVHQINDDCWCEGPFTSCQPPELPEAWELYVEEPGSDELFLMNIHARQLLMELNS